MDTTVTDEARKLAVEMAVEELKHLNPFYDGIPNLWEDIDPESEEWEKLKALVMPDGGNELVKFVASSPAGRILSAQTRRDLKARLELVASSRASFLFGIEIGRKMTEQRTYPFSDEHAVCNQAEAHETAPAPQETPVSSAQQECRALEERYFEVYKRIEAANEPEERKRLLSHMDDLVCNRLELENHKTEAFPEF